MILALETSCDECSAAVVSQNKGENKIRVHSLVTFSQIKIHAPYGGVVPEIASRNHLETVNHVINDALMQADIPAGELDAIAVTNRPGLIGALLVGVSAAKTLAYALEKPLIPIHHLEGHACSVFLEQGQEIKYPCLMAIVSGGHTVLLNVLSEPASWPLEFLKSARVATSRDDAAGEAFDKTAKLMGLGYPGGAQIDALSKTGNPAAFKFPRALPQKDILDFSFSGLKTAVAQTIKDLKKTDPELKKNIHDLCASTQEAIVDALLSKIELAAQRFSSKQLVFVGGVSANSRVRSRLSSEWNQMGFSSPPLFPNLAYCTDNAAMIGAAAIFRYGQGHFLQEKDRLVLNAQPYAEF